MELLNPNGNGSDPNDEQGFQVNAGLRIRGGRSRTDYNPKHSFRLFFRTEYGDATLNYPIHGEDEVSEFKELDLRTLQAPSWHFDGVAMATWLPDPLARMSLGALGQPTTQSAWLHLYINGQYWGLYQTQERADANYAESHLGGQSDNYDVLKPEPDLGYRVEAKDGNLDAYARLWEQAVARDEDGITPAFADNNAYMRAQGKNPDGSLNPDFETLLDVDNLIDYMMLVIYIGSTDGPITQFSAGSPNSSLNNFVAIRDRTGDSGFQFIAHDMEVSLQDGELIQQLLHPQDGQVVNRNGPFNDANFDTNPDHFNPQWLHQQLMANDEYRLRFADSIQSAFFNGGPLAIDQQIERLDDQSAIISQALLAESARWGDAYSGGIYPPLGGLFPARTDDPIRQSDWAATVQMMRSQYFPARQEIVIQQWKETTLGLKDGIGGYSISVPAPLFPDVDAPQFLINGIPQHGGNTSQNALLSPAPSANTVYYTTDGSDPRMLGGDVAPNANQFGLPLELNKPTIVTMRARRADGTWSPLEQALFSTPAASASSENLRITELNYNPYAPTDGLSSPLDDADSYEFIELRNISTEAISLSGVALSDGIEFSFDTGGIPGLEPGAHVLIVKNRQAFESRYGSGLPIAGEFATGNLSNSGESIELQAADASIIQSFVYDDADGWPKLADGAGNTLVVVNLGEDYSDPNNWQSSHLYGGSPGTEEPSRLRDVIINEVLSHTDLPQVDSIELVNTSANTIDIGGWYLSDSKSHPMKFRIPDNTILAANEYVVFDETQFNPSPVTPSENYFALDGAGGDDILLLAVDSTGNPTRFADHVEFGAQANGESWGRWPNADGPLYPMNSISLGAANSGPRVGPVVISEVNYNPVAPADGFEDYLYEFVEILNFTDSAINMSQWRLAGGVDFAFPDNFLLAPKSNLVVVPFDPNDLDNAQLVVSFQNVYGASTIDWLGGWSGKLDNAGESIRLLRPDAPPADAPDLIPLLLEDEVTYDDQTPWPTSADGDGDSLNRNSETGWGNDPTSWDAAAPSPGNSDLIYQPQFPTVESVTIQAGLEQRSFVRTVQVDFVGQIDSEALVSNGNVIGTMVTLHCTEEHAVALTADQFSSTYNALADITSFFITLDTGANADGSAKDGIYTVIIDASVVNDTDGNALDGDGNGVGGDDFHITFHQLSGDVTGDGTVNDADLEIVDDALGATVGSTNWNTNADLDDDGAITQADRVMVLRNEGNHVVDNGAPIACITEFSVYDANDKGDVTALDALVIINHLAKADSEIATRQIARYDVNIDGNITALDALVVINALPGFADRSPEGSQMQRQDEVAVNHSLAFLEIGDSDSFDDDDDDISFLANDWLTLVVRTEKI